MPSKDISCRSSCVLFFKVAEPFVQYLVSADPDSYVRGGTTMITFLFHFREIIQQNTTQSRPPSNRQRNTAMPIMAQN